jgi:hypothetical protein
MPEILIDGDALPTLARASQDVGLAALIGGNLFGRVALNPALEDIGDKSERGRVLNRAWRRYGTVNSLALAALVGGWAAARLGEARPRHLSPAERRLATAKDVAVGAVVVTGLASAVGGVEFARQAPGGAVPIESGRDPAPETPVRAAGLKRAVNALGALNLGSELALAGINAALSEAAFRRPPARRLLRRGH